MALTPATRGVFPIAPTPFLPNGDLDYASVDRLMDFYLCSIINAHLSCAARWSMRLSGRPRPGFQTRARPKWRLFWTGCCARPACASGVSDTPDCHGLFTPCNSREKRLKK